MLIRSSIIEASLLAVVAMGCSSEVGSSTELGQRSSESTEVQPQTVTPLWSEPYEFTPFGWVGGTGGGNPYGLGCPGGYVVVGFYGRSGSWMDNLGFICGYLNSNGTIAGTFQTGKGGGTGGSYFSWQCPTNQFVTDIWVGYGTYINGIEAYCSTASDAAADKDTSGFYTVGYPLAPNWVHWDCDAAGFSHTSPPGPAALMGFYMQSQSYIDRVEPICVRLNP